MKLKICCGLKAVGVLTYNIEDDTYHVAYDAKWREEGYPLAPLIPFDESGKSSDVRKFLLNLFPEGKHLDELVSRVQISKSNTFSILQTIGSDPTGAFSFIEGDCLINKDSFREVTSFELNERIKKTVKLKVYLFGTIRRV